MRWICYGRHNREPFFLDREAFEADTLNKPPYTHEYRTYAVCPHCFNPVQIIGLKKELKNTPEPYAKHALIDIPGLDAVIDREAYLNCPYADPARKPKNLRNAQRKSYGLGDEIKNTFWTQFDRIIYVLENQLGMQFSDLTLKALLRDYIGLKGWNHPEATLNNIPWMFLYCTTFNSLWQCSFSDESVINAVSKVKKAVFEGTVLSKEGFGGLGFCTIHHRCIVKANNDVKETFKFVIARNMEKWFKENGISETNFSQLRSQILFVKELVVDGNYFYRLTHTNNPKYVEIHNEQLSKRLRLLEGVGFPKPNNLTE